MGKIESFCGQNNGYSLSKTLRFELKPQGKTLENIQKSGLIKADKQKSKDYQDVKKILDNYHKYFIDDILKKASGQKIDWTPLQNAVAEYQKDRTKDGQLIEVQDKMRVQLVQCFTVDKRFNTLTKSTPKDLFEDLLPAYLASSDNKELNEKAIETFKAFSTYFTGYQETRKNIYSKEAIATAVAFRIVHENFPKFLQNLSVYNQLKEKCPDVLKDAECELGSILNKESLDSFFTVNAFNNFLSQSGSEQQKGIDFYNQLIGGVSGKSGDKKIKGINECINLYWQQHPDFAKNNRRIKMVPLYKQILSDRTTLSFVIESIENDKELFDALKGFNDSLKNMNVFSSCCDLVDRISECSQDHLFVNAKDLTEISRVLFGKWDELQIRMNEYARETFSTKQEKNRWTRDPDEEDRNTKRNGAFSFSEINAVLGFSSTVISGTDIRMGDYFNRQYRKKFDNDFDKLVNTQEIAVMSVTEIIGNIDEKWKSLQDLITDFSDDDQLKDVPDNIAVLKEYLDAVQELFHRIQIMNVDKAESRDEDFYAVYDDVFSALSEIRPLYNKVRNYITKKALDVGKYKLNFDTPALAAGWDLNKESNNSCVLMIKDDNYYLGIMNAKDKPKFPDPTLVINSPADMKDGNLKSQYAKMIYKQFDCQKQIPKCSTQRKDVTQFFKDESNTEYRLEGKDFIAPVVITREVWWLNNSVWDVDKKEFVPKISSGYKKFQKKYLELTGDKKGFEKALEQWIGFCQDFLRSYKSTSRYDFRFKKPNEYSSLDEFYKELNDTCYKISFAPVSVPVIDDWVEKGKLYLFQIYNKDFASGSKGMPNMHTLYWKNLFSDENLSDVVLKLNGEAELFYRDTGIKDPVVHRAGEKMVNRTTKDHHSLPESVHNEIFKFVNNKLPENKLSSEAKQYLDSKNVIIREVKSGHEIIKDRHYTEPKFLFHVPITINYKASGNSFINKRVRKFLQNNPDVNIIGLDRGERHLIYMSLINQKGEIIEQRTFNTVERSQGGNSGNKVSVNYHEKLDHREKERDAARKNWQTIGKIAELKEGYLSAVIHEIAALMVKHNAIIVMEDLNFGFKRGRFHVEKQVYQKFEHMLIDKLNYLVFKDRGLKDPGGVLNGYQLAEQFESFQRLGKQSGFLFYVPAGYTSKIDPVTGFVNLLDLKNLTNVEKKRDFFAKFEDIHYDSAKKMFSFTFDYDSFPGKGAQEMYKKKWTVYTNGDRIKFCGKGKTPEHVNITSELKELFEQHGIAYENGCNLLDEIQAKGADSDSLKDRNTIGFFDRLYRSFALTLQMRNSDAGTGDDYIISPVMDANGNFYDSRDYEKAGKKANLPIDADANGAYHIALKGLYLIDKFNNATDLEKGERKVDMRIQNKDWFAFRQK